MKEQPTVCAICGGGHETSGHPITENKVPQDEALQRKLSRVVLNVGKRDKKGLFDRLTAKNAGTISAALDKPPVFYENDPTAEGSVELGEEIKDLMPPEFFENPTQWIEQQKPIERHHGEGFLPEGTTVRELFDLPYDVSKVKLLELGENKKNVIVKRLASDNIEEVAIAKRAYEAGVPTPKVLGEVRDRGNMYVFFEHIEGMNARAVGQKFDIAWTSRAPKNYIPDAKNLQDVLGSNATKFQPEVQAKLFGMWEKEKRKLYLSERFRKFRTVIMREILTHPQQDPVVVAAFSSKYPGTTETAEDALNDCEEACRLFGFASAEDLARSIKENIANLDPIEKRETAQKEALMADYEAEWLDVVENAVYGCNLEDEKQKILSTCEKAGIQHHDFTDLNLLIPWDFEKDSPKNEEGKPPVHVIDWEQRILGKS